MAKPELREQLRLMLSDADPFLVQKYYQICIMSANQMDGYKKYLNLLLNGLDASDHKNAVPAYLHDVQMGQLDSNNRFEDLWHIEVIMHLCGAIQSELKSEIFIDYTKINWGVEILDLPAEGIRMFPYSQKEYYYREEVYNRFLMPTDQQAYPSEKLERAFCNCETFPHKLDCKIRYDNVSQEEECHFPDRCKPNLHIPGCRIQKCLLRKRAEYEAERNKPKDPQTLRKMARATVGENELYKGLYKDSSTRSPCAKGENCPVGYSHSLTCVEKQMKDKAVKHNFYFSHRQTLPELYQENVVVQPQQQQQQRARLDRNWWDWVVEICNYTPF